MKIAISGQDWREGSLGYKIKGILDNLGVESKILKDGDSPTAHNADIVLVA